MRKLILLIVALTSASAFAANTDARILSMEPGDVTPVHITTSKHVALKGVTCACTGIWLEAPMIDLINLQTGATYASGVECSSGEDNAHEHEVGRMRSLGKGTFVGVQITTPGVATSTEPLGKTVDGLRVLRQASCMATVRYGRSWWK